MSRCFGAEYSRYILKCYSSGIECVCWIYDDDLERSGFLSPVSNLFCTSRLTRDARRFKYLLRNLSTAVRSRLLSSRRDQESALTTISSRSLTSRRQILSVREVSPVPPRARLFNGTVLTSAARLHQRFWECAQRHTTLSGILRSRQAGPATYDAKQSTSAQLFIPRPSTAISVDRKSCCASL